VYVTLGTVMGNMDESKSLFTVLLDGVRDLPIRVLLTIGKDLPLSALGDVPPNVRVERFVPQDDVIPHAAAVVCHGGSGTMLGTAAAGVPMVVVPMFADQPQNAERVAAVGAGLALPKGGATPEGIRAALTRVLAEHSFRDVARKLAKEIAALPVTDEVVTELERLANAR
jgi:MGT family glycosyltransferase